MVYFIRRPNGDIKIGTTERMEVRLPKLEQDEGCKLEVLGVVDGNQGRERELHRQFASYRKEGEWFGPGDALTAFIEVNASPWDREANVACMVAIRCTAPYKEHLLSIAAQETRTPAQVIERALRNYARDNGYQPLPPR